MRRRFINVIKDRPQTDIVIYGEIEITQLNNTVGYKSETGGYAGGGHGSISCNMGDKFINALFVDSNYRVMFYSVNEESKYLLFPYIWSNIRLTIGDRLIDTGSHSMNDKGVCLILSQIYNPPKEHTEFGKYFYNLRGKYRYHIIFQK